MLRDAEMCRSTMAIMEPSRDDAKPIRLRETMTSQKDMLFEVDVAAVVVFPGAFPAGDLGVAIVVTWRKRESWQSQSGCCKTYGYFDCGVTSGSLAANLSNA
jgi:hypothetical protein